MADDESGRPAALTCADGRTLTVRAFEPASRPDRVVLLAPATGVPARFYAAFAGWLATRGYACVTWDWRGSGENSAAPVAETGVSMLDWATLDLPAAIDWAQARYDRPLIGIGHSFGGQAFGLADRPGAFESLVLFASGHAYWRHWPVPGRYLFRAAISVLLATTKICGYLPGRSIGLGADLPAGVADQWLRWCLRPDYFGRWDGHAALTAPVLSYAFSDDSYAPRTSREALLAKYGGPKCMRTPSPADFGLRRVGHLDFFRRRHAGSLWPAFLGELESLQR